MTFAFHANTLGFGGQVEEFGRTKYLPSQASVILPPGGGIGETFIQDYSEGEISFSSARSFVSGSSVGDASYNTYANVTVSNIDIAGRIQVSVLNSSVVSRNQRDANGCIGESRITFGGEIVGLVIDGHVIDVELDHSPFRNHATYAEFVNAFTTMNEQQVIDYAESFNWPFDECFTEEQVGTNTVRRFHVPRRCTGGIRASLLRRTDPVLFDGQINGIKRKGFTIEVSGVGLIHLGEVLLKAGRRRVNMMRVELGKTLDGAPMSRVALRDAAGEPRMEAAAVTTGTEGIMLLAGSPGGSGGSYTFASGEGNGTDFLP